MRITREGYVPRWATGGPASGVTVGDPGGFTPPLTGPDLDTVIQELLDLIAAGGGDFLEIINGGGGTVQAHGNLGSTETIDTANGNYHWGTLNANCTFTFTTTVDTAERWFTLELIEDGTGTWTVTLPGSVAWLGGSTPTHDTTAGTTTIYAFFTRNGGTTWIGGQLGGGGSSTDLDAILAASTGQDIADALLGAAAPDAGNVFATMADVTGGSSLSRCKAYNTTTQSVSTGTALTFDAEEYDTDTYHDNSTNPTRFTVPATGDYEFMGGSFFDSATGGGPLIFLKNGTTEIRGSAQSLPNAATYGQASGAAQLTAGDYIEIIYQGGNTVTAGHASVLSAQSWFAIKRIG